MQLGEIAGYVEDNGIRKMMQADNDCLEMASMINTAPIFMGNQSLACSVALGLGKTCFVEEGRSSANYIFPFRKNAFYI